MKARLLSLIVIASLFITACGGGGGGGSAPPGSNDNNNNPNNQVVPGTPVISLISQVNSDDLQWEPVENATDYVVEYASLVDFSDAQSVIVEATSWSIIAGPDNERFYRVKARANGTEGEAFSNIVQRLSVSFIAAAGDKVIETQFTVEPGWDSHLIILASNSESTDILNPASDLDVQVLANGISYTVQLQVVQGSSRFIGENISVMPFRQPVLSLGSGNTCRVHVDGKLYCVGSNRDGQLGDGTNLSQTNHIEISNPNGTEWRYVSRHSSHTCAIDINNQLYCWGRNTSGQLGNNTQGSGTSTNAPGLVNGDTNWRQVAVSAGHTCAIKTSNQLYCWGENDSGQLGQGNNTFSSVPLIIPGNKTWKEVAVGYKSTCAIDTADVLYCWGARFLVGNTQSTANALSPELVTNGADWRDISMTDRFSCGVKLSGRMFCWGQNSNGQLGNGNVGTNSQVPAQVGTATNWVDVAVGFKHACAVNDLGNVFCWGENNNGQAGQDVLGNFSNPSNYPDPMPVGDSSGWQSVSVGSQHSCATRSPMEVVCWGQNMWGELAYGISGNKGVPTQIDNNNDWQQISNGLYFSCGLKMDGNLYCWGSNNSAQNGKGDLIDSKSPQLVDVSQVTNTNWVEISSGGYHACAINSARELYCWGSNLRGTTGMGDQLLGQDIMRATRVGAATDWLTVSGGPDHSCGIRQNVNRNDLYCWGQNTNGQLGDNTNTQRTSPTLVPGQINWQQVSSGYYHTCAIDVDSNLYCWGQNTSGQLGLNDINPRLIPTLVGTGWNMVDSGIGHSCGIRQNNSQSLMYCWGDNRRGQIGNGGDMNTDFLVPQPVGNIVDWEAVSVSYIGTSCGVRFNGGDRLVLCWGDGGDGVLGISDYNDAFVPALVSNNSGWTGISLKGRHACGLKGNSLYCWGQGNSGQIGDGHAWQTSPVSAVFPATE